jgi:hypothetical protein
MMRRAILLLMVLATTSAVASGAALAVTRVVGGPGNDVVLGTEGDDDLAGRPRYRLRHRLRG